MSSTTVPTSSTSAPCRRLPPNLRPQRPPVPSGPGARMHSYPPTPSSGEIAMSKPAENDAFPATDALIVERRFTPPGVLPFDEVEGELRAAVIGAPADPAFEQRGVEFPSF